ncbi:hypothetical protein AMECASPLE_029854 [Ameca splendens]|uniref:Uncharacterized protein n=1 Tax=Ameca splendens TaxID=208324 RepID=A0ABV0YH04_9TELE
MCQPLPLCDSCILSWLTSVLTQAANVRFLSRLLFLYCLLVYSSTLRTRHHRFIPQRSTGGLVTAAVENTTDQINNFPPQSTLTGMKTTGLCFGKDLLAQKKNQQIKRMNTGSEHTVPSIFIGIPGKDE